MRGCGRCVGVLFLLGFARPSSLAAGAPVTQLDPKSWQRTVVGRDWLVYFTVQGCKHCERLAPMMDYVAEQAPELRVGRVDATTHNGLARTFGMDKFPSIARFDAQSVMYEYTGRQRTPQQLIAFARGDHSLGSAGTAAPTKLLANVPDWWIMLEALWPPFRMALTWAVGIALGIKGLAMGCLKLLKRGEKPRKPRRPKEERTEPQQPDDTKED